MLSKMDAVDMLASKKNRPGTDLLFDLSIYKAHREVTAVNRSAFHVVHILGRPGGVRAPFSLHNLKVVGSSLGGALAVLGHSLSVTITEILKAMVCGALSMGHCT